jgi:NTP pyrophosphatase (non-canonical NTP hydrolase)
MSWNEYELKVIRWSEDRKIIPNSTPAAQLTKAYEEMGELKHAIETNDRAGIIDGLGDVLVCLINVSALADLDLTECLMAAYEEIKDRKGYLSKEGVFIKEAS